MIAAPLVALALSVLSCGDGHTPAADCPTMALGVYDAQTWIGPTEADMVECLQMAEEKVRAGHRAKCEIIYADSLKPAAYPAPKVSPTWTF